MKNKIQSSCAVIAVLAFLSGISGMAHAGMISGSDIAASSDLSNWSRFPIEQIADGITSDDSPLNGYVSYASAGTISLSFVEGPWDLSSFTLWNDINIQHEGVSSFRLDFLDANDSMLGSTSVFSTLAISPESGEVFDFDMVAGVSSVDLVVLSSKRSFNRIEIREVAFEGTRAQVPVPNTVALLAMGLALVGLGGRSKGRRS